MSRSTVPMRGSHKPPFLGLPSSYVSGNLISVTAMSRISSGLRMPNCTRLTCRSGACDSRTVAMVGRSRNQTHTHALGWGKQREGFGCTGSPVHSAPPLKKWASANGTSHFHFFFLLSLLQLRLKALFYEENMGDVGQVFLDDQPVQVDEIYDDFWVLYQSQLPPDRPELHSQSGRKIAFARAKNMALVEPRAFQVVPNAHYTSAAAAPAKPAFGQLAK
eukprot:m.294010 g.294010  ORF g.294010 m.294010 type:complete len:219 (-) comp22962_c0_seq12:43-699(-)